MITGTSITVAELIEELKEFDPTTEVVVPGIDSAGNDWGYKPVLLTEDDNKAVVRAAVVFNG